MKIVAFLCLLTFTTCLAAQPLQQEAKQAPSSTITETVTVQTTIKPGEHVPVPEAPVQTAALNKTVTPEAKKEDNKTKITTESTTQVKPSTVKPDELSNKTDYKIVDKDAKEQSAPKPTTEAIKPEQTEASPKKNETSSSTETKKEVTTSKAEFTKPTEAPTNSEPAVQARSFDGPSFVGGIILSLGLLAIGFMGFKYYKNHTERNYHTL